MFRCKVSKVLIICHHVSELFMGWDRHSKRQVFQWHLVVLTILGEWRNIPWIIFFFAKKQFGMEKLPIYNELPVKMVICHDFPQLR